MNRVLPTEIQWAVEVVQGKLSIIEVKHRYTFNMHAYNYRFLPLVKQLLALKNTKNNIKKKDQSLLLKIKIYKEFAEQVKELDAALKQWIKEHPDQKESPSPIPLHLLKVEPIGVMKRAIKTITLKEERKELYKEIDSTDAAALIILQIVEIL